jgi:hypothetical protein
MSLTRPEVLADPGRYEQIAQRIFEIAIAEGRCAELLLSLFAGAGCTISPDGERRVWWLSNGKEGGVEACTRSTRRSERRTGDEPAPA